jgi:hypothetical protein
MVGKDMDDLKTMADGSAVTLGLGTFMNYVNLPLIIQLLTAGYLLVRIWESKTVQGWFGRNKSVDTDFAMGDVPNTEDAVIIQRKKKPIRKKANGKRVS